MTNIDVQSRANDIPPKGRLILGGAIFVFGLSCPVLVPLVLASGLPAGWKSVLSGLLLLGIPELFTIAAVAVLGKAGFNYLKSRLYAAFKRHAAPPEIVSRRRYRIGLALFVLPLFFGFLAPYVGSFIPGFDAHSRVISAAGDVLLLSSLFVLGGDFWDKLQALFIYDARAHLPARSAVARRAA